MKILVTGSNGQLGSELKLLAPEYPGFDFLFTDVGELDITDEIAIDSMVLKEKPDAIINCAAYTAVDKAEKEESMAYLINAKAPGNLAKIAARYNLFLVHISTDYVFGGTGYRPYSENDKKDPVSVYAKSKNAGEAEVLTHAKTALIIRTSWLYSEFGNNFVKTIIKYAKERGALNVIYDQIGSPTYARDLAQTILAVIQKCAKPKGVNIYHYANEGVASWYDFAQAIIEITGIPCKIKPVETHEYPLPAARPFYSVLNKAKVKQAFNLEIPYWRDSLADCIGRLKSF